VPLAVVIAIGVVFWALGRERAAQPAEAGNELRAAV
jgi:hypothetical protein